VEILSKIKRPICIKRWSFLLQVKLSIEAMVYGTTDIDAKIAAVKEIL
jgi:hypothetical protein